MLHQIPRELLPGIQQVIQALADNPTPVGMVTDPDEPSYCQVAAPGDYVITYEIVDERHILRILTVED
jgi:hypothetical protein